MLKMFFNFKDVFRAARLGFSPKKIWAFFCGLLLGLAIYNLFSYLAHAAAGRPLAETWTMFGLLPLPWSDFGGWAWILWFLGAAGLGITYMLTSAMVARITAEQLSGNEFYEIQEAVGFIKKNWKAVLGGPLMIALFIGFLLLAGMILGWWGRIPYLGELTVSLLAIPVYLVCLFIAFLLAALMAALFYSPVVAGAAKSDTFDNLFEIFSALTSQPWRLVIYTGLLKMVCLAGFITFGMFTVGAMMVAFHTLGFAMGEKFVNIAVAGFNSYTPGWVMNVLIKLSGGCGPCQFLLTVTELGWAGQVSAFFIGMSINAVLLLVLAYLMSTWVVGQTIIYGIIVMKRDQRNIFERNDETESRETEELEECPPISGEPVHKAAKTVKKATAVKKPAKAKK
jgi:hypothetical protein